MIDIGRKISSSGRGANDADIVAPPPASFCENGTIGWEDGSWYQLAGATDDGPLLVHVTLFAGKSPSVAPKPGVALGYPILCRVNTMFGHRVPPKGTACVVMAPGGDWETAGNPVIVALIEKNPLTQIDPLRVVLYFGDTIHVLVKGKSASLQDVPASPGPSCFVGVGTPFTGGPRGINAIDETGSGFSTQSGEVGLFASSGGTATVLVHLTATEADILVKGSTLCGLKATGGDITLFGANSYLYSAGVYLGALATALNTALWGPTGVAGAASTSVYLSP